MGLCYRKLLRDPDWFRAVSTVLVYPRMASDAILEGIIASLNKQQRAAVQFDCTKALQVIAGPGTGKTKVLTSRVAFLLLHHRIKPQDIIVTTFTNKAAKEMIDRLTNMLQHTNIRVSDIMIGTFHSVCLKILTRFGHKLGLQRDWRIIEESEIDKIMQEMIDKMPDAIRDHAHSMSRKVNLCLPKRGSDEWAVHAKPLKKNISRLKAYAILPEEYNKDPGSDQALAYFYEKYQAELGKLNALDFDDLLMYAFRLLSRERCLPYIQHVLVDEFQDTNGIQMDLMFLFSKANHHLSRGITVVGDPDQSIYAFRHALAMNFEAMSTKCPIECSRIVLVENYRSSQKILNTSETLIRQQLKGRHNRLPLHAQFDCEFAPVYIDFPAAFLEGPSLVREMLYLKALPNIFTYNDFAILVRQRRQIKNIETALIEHGVPYKIIRGHAFWELKEIRSMLNLLKCVYSENEKLAIISALQYPSKGLGATSIGRIKVTLDAFPGPAFEGLRQICGNKTELTIPGKGRTSIKEFIKMIEECQNLCQSPNSLTLSCIFDKLYECSGMRTEYLYYDGKKKSDTQVDQEPNFSNPRHKNVMILKNYFTGTDMTSLETSADSVLIDGSPGAKGHEVPISTKSGIKNHIRNFFLSLTLFSTETSDSELDKAKRMEQDKIGFVTISTIHGAKGLEWPVVFIPGCEEGIIPSVFGDEKVQDGAENEDDSGDEGDKDNFSNGGKRNDDITASPKTKTQNADSSLDEERRMFFVAQTRAKHLLYHSAAKSDRSEGPSRFLTGELLSTMADQQKLFDSVASIKKFYQHMSKKPPSEGKFKLRRLVEDYAKFIENRRERFVWNGEFITHTFKLDLSKNTDGSISDSFTTAAAQLQNFPASTIEEAENFNGSSLVGRSLSPRGYKYSKSNSPKKLYAPHAKGKLGPISPTKTFAPVSPSGSPTAKRSLAPVYKPTRNAPNTLQCTRRLFAPGQNVPKLKSEASTSSTSISSDGPNSASSRQDLVETESKKAPKTNGKLQDIKIVEMKNIEEREAFVSTFKRTCKPQTSKRRLVTTPINISDAEEFSHVKPEDTTVNYSLLSDERGNNTTAAELLHDPNDMTIDTRPIISNAKTLADAARKSSRADNDRDKRFSQKLKKEGSSNEIDIFSQLSRARKKAKIDDKEIIIID